MLPDNHYYFPQGKTNHGFSFIYVSIKANYVNFWV